MTGEKTRFPPGVAPPIGFDIPAVLSTTARSGKPVCEGVCDTVDTCDWVMVWVRVAVVVLVTDAVRLGVLLAVGV